MSARFMNSLSGQKSHNSDTEHEFGLIDHPEKSLHDSFGELEHLIDSLAFAAKDHKEKSLNVSTSLYLCTQRLRKKSKWKLAMYSTICVLLIAYCVASFFLDVPYWMVHGYHYHLQHFKWYSSLNGEYCNDRSMDNDWTYALSQNNTDFDGTRSRILLLSYPRSGNHLTKAMLECLLQQPTYGYSKEKNDGAQQDIAMREATIQHPYIRKIHSPQHLGEARDWKQWGLIYLIRDPIESVMSENKYVPRFWKDYEWQFEMNFMKNPLFYSQWSGDGSKLIIFYEDYFNGNHGINLRKLGTYFGKERVSMERVSYCIEHYDEIINAGLNSLDRGASSHINLHYYRDKYFGTDTETQPVIKVPSYLYDDVFSRYENFESC